ncbi:hypothetical protein RchiOBHm_Chr6g0260571 [Rosa chinensis]|uniref:Uncharacterized protein n=1 Tax=Rosa chinensis TaxID=74649 RepID=A0A2P6PN55_ROSCH|nr:hypothetical protein RchiOBHm_Chr6g0260571 [Rosa chinensis]
MLLVFGYCEIGTICYGVRQEAAVAYGALCDVVCSIPITSNGRQNHVMLGSLVDRFIGWALPLLSNISARDGTAELALDVVQEYLNVGDVGGIEKYALSILKVCQFLVEVENLLESVAPPSRYASHGTLQHFRMLLALLSCFSTVLQSTASGSILSLLHLSPFFPFLVDENQSSNSRMSGLITWVTGLVYQAEGKYEKAAAHFTCYRLRSHWVPWVLMVYNLPLHVSSSTLHAKHAGKSYCGALTTTGNEINAIHALAQYDEGEYQAAWACLGLTPKSSSELALDPKLALQRSEHMLLQAMLFQNGEKEDEVPHELEKARSMLEETLSVLPLVARWARRGG